MAIKMRILHTPGKKKFMNIANMIKAEYDLSINSVDKIPPAYSCDKERLVILALTVKKEPDDVLRRFCAELDKKKAANVALVIDGTEEAANAVKAVLQAAGTNVVDEVVYVASAGFLNLNNKVTAEDVQKFLSWAENTIQTYVR